MNGQRATTLCVFSLCALCLSGSFLFADERKPRLEPGSAPDVVDVVYLGKVRPILIRIHLLVDGKPYSQAWDAYVQKLFQYADRNRDGSLDAEECKKLFPGQLMQQMVRGNIFAFANVAAPTLDQLDQNKDGKVSLEELKSYYVSQAQVSAIQIQPGFNQIDGSQLTAALFKHLGAKDGKLELARIVDTDALFARLDANDDETIDPI